MKPSRLIILCLAAGAALPACARTTPATGMSAERITVRDGLSSNIVSCMVQDAAGYVWIATYNGLNVFDGYAVTAYPAPPGSVGGPAPIVAMAEDRGRGVLSLTASNGRTTDFSLAERRYVGDGGETAGKRRRGPVIARFNGVTYTNNGDGSVTRTAPGCRPRTMRLLPRHILDYTRQDHFHAVRLPDGREAVSTYGAGLFLYDPAADLLTQLTAANSGGLIANDYITALMADRSGCLWLAEEYSGLTVLRFNGLRHSRIMADPGAAIPDKNYVRHVALTADGSLLLTDNYGTCSTVDLRSGAATGTGYSGAHVYCTLTDSRGRRWTGTRGGGLYLDGRRLTTANSPLPSMDVYDIAEGRGGAVWLATLGGGIARAVAEPGGGVRMEVFAAGGGASSKTHDIETDSRGRLWVASEGGLWVSADGGAEPFKLYGSSDGSLPCDYFVCLEADSAGNVWAGSVGGGLLRCTLSGGRMAYAAVTTRQGLAADDVYSLAADADGRIWAGTEYGLSCVSTRGHSVSNYFFGGSTLGNTYSEKACAALPDGSMVFGTHLGAVRIWPGEAGEGAATHSTRVTSVEINGGGSGARRRSHHHAL